jgi:glycosyltransferase 2 family protein
VTKQIFWIAVKYGLGIGLLAYVVWRYWSLPSPDGKEDLGLVGAFDKPWNTEALLLAGAICLASVLLTFVRWYVLVRAQGLPFTLLNAFRLGLIGYYLSTFLPGSVGGDIIKAAQIAREQNRRTVAVSTVLIDRVIGLCGLFWLVALLGTVYWVTGFLRDSVTTAGVTNQTGVVALETIVLGAWALVLASLVFWFFLGVLPFGRAERFASWLDRIPKVGHALAEFWRAVWMYRLQGRSVLLGVFLAVVGHVGFVLTFYFSSLTLTPPDKIPSPQAHFLVVPVGMAIQAGFPSPGGVGGGEYGYGKLYDLLGFAFAAGVLGSLIQRLITWALGLAGYLVYLRMRPFLRPMNEEAGKETLPFPTEASGNHDPGDLPLGQAELTPPQRLAGGS